jgi:hypothetical protein
MAWFTIVDPAITVPTLDLYLVNAAPASDILTWLMDRFPALAPDGMAALAIGHHPALWLGNTADADRAWALRVATQPRKFLPRTTTVADMVNLLGQQPADRASIRFTVPHITPHGGDVVRGTLTPYMPVTAEDLAAAHLLSGLGSAASNTGTSCWVAETHSSPGT